MATALWLLQDRQHRYVEQSAFTAGVRLTAAKDTLSISLRQLAAIPLNLSHRTPTIQALAAPPASSAATGLVYDSDRSEVGQALSRISADFAVPLVALINREGRIVAANRLPGNVSNDVSMRTYFSEAMSRGAATQFLLGRATREPGVYFSQRVVNNGTALGVVVVKQDSKTLNRLFGDADGASVLVTDNNGVVVLGNRDDMLLQRVPGGPTHPDDYWDAIYQRVPTLLNWSASEAARDGATPGVARVGGLRHVTRSSPLGDTPFKLWVLEPLGEEAAITRSTLAGAALLWLAGGLLIWMNWRRMQLLAAALQARRELYDLAQALPVTVFRYVQPATGTPRFAFLGRGVEDLFGVRLPEIEQDPILPWRLGGTGGQPPTRPQEFMLRKGDRTTWLLADSTVTPETDGSTTYNGYWLDVTERRETRARLSAVFEHAPTSYLFFDAQHGITHCNPAALRLFGVADAGLLIGRTLWFPGLSADVQADGLASRDSALAALREHSRSGQRVRSFEWRFKRGSGDSFDAEVHVIAIDWSGSPTFCAVVQDISVRKQAQLAMQLARDAAEDANRTKSSFLANMSHELRTPMNAILGMTHLALEDGLPDKQRDYVQKAHSSASSLLQILNDILDLSKIEAGQLALERIDFELESVVSEMADVVGLKAEQKGLELVFSAAPDLPRRLIGDPTRLRQVLVNLASNAVKFTDAGEVNVGMELGAQDDDSVELHGWVRDTGVGMSPQEMGRLFEPFVQADNSTTRRFGGTGLGLVISRQLVERMGGRMWIESEPNRGSTFHFTARLGRSVPRAPARAWMANELRGQRALLVDDTPAALEALGNMLEALGVIVDRAGGGEEALCLIDASPEPHTWYLLDWKMPGMDGVECARRILARHALVQPCILLVTAFARDDALRAAAGLALAGILQKPVTPSSLHDCLVQARRKETPLSAGARRVRTTSDLSEAVRKRLAGARILLVEDNALNQQLASELLRRAGMDVVVADNGAQALERLASDGPFDGVLMDCQMPVMDGYIATRTLRANAEWQTLPVIAMTASALAEDRDRALASGMNAHITKPIHVESMLLTMARWIGTRGAAPLDESALAETTVATSAAAAIDTTDGLAHCVGNPELYRRLLEGFRKQETDFASALAAALAEQRWSDALHRTHDMKGLAGTIGARRLHAAVTALYRALATQQGAEALVLAQTVADELVRVLGEIDTLVPAR
ncbi:MAG: response regulator [Burkholderiales bacterium]|nr:response regulator [Burkholderiales bacterium]